MAKLFGFKIEKDDEQSKGVVSPVPQTNEDSSDYYVSSGFYGQYVDIDGVFKSEFELIKRYREMALHPDCLLYTSPSPRDQRGSGWPGCG